MDRICELGNCAVNRLGSGAAIQADSTVQMFVNESGYPMVIDCQAITAGRQNPSKGTRRWMKGESGEV